MKYKHKIITEYYDFKHPSAGAEYYAEIYLTPNKDWTEADWNNLDKYICIKSYKSNKFGNKINGFISENYEPTNSTVLY